MLVETHITISGTRKVVWDAITNIRDAANIISGIEKIELLNTPANGLVGLKWRETRMYFGKPAAIEKWITHAVDNEYYTTRAEMDGYVFITTLKISGNDGNIKLSSSHETQSQGVIAKIKSLPMVFFKGVLKKAILQDLMDIKKVVEDK
jgi:hypothetical protein